MKISYLKYAALAAVMSLGSCSNDYLDTDPTNKTSPDVVFQTTENVKMLVNGLAKIMTAQHISSQGFNGEGTIKLYYGEYPGQNFRANLKGAAGDQVMGKHFLTLDSSYNYFPWHYYYMLIGNANDVIENVDSATGPESDKKDLKAQALGYRAYAYTMLLQIYGQRWVDSNDGKFQALPLRLTNKEPKDLEFATMADVYAQIYEDLNNAKAFFSSTNFDRKTENFVINKDVIHAIHARAALNRQDYATAAQEAGLAREKYPLMTTEEYQNGFATPNSEWIWSSYGASTEQLHYYSYFAYVGYNANTTQVKSYPKRIAKELYDVLPDTDIRKGLFLDPRPYPSDSYNHDDGIVKSAKAQMNVDAREKYPDLDGAAKVAAYMQFKFKANELPGVGHLNHFRASEMLLIQAESKYYLGDEAGANELLVELNTKTNRDPDYTVNKNGNELFQEIVKYRGLELWGEGFDWFDYKRWNKTIVRLSAAEGGNFSTSLAGEMAPDYGNKWTYKTPNKENDYNHGNK